MKLLVGLGNPGRDYARTRHNVGFRILARFAERHGSRFTERTPFVRMGHARVADTPVVLALPETFMNRCGTAVLDALAARPLEDVSRDLILVVDDVDLPLGQLRIRPRGGAGGHRGLQDVIDALGHPNLPRLRFGIGRPPPGISTTEYVLEPFSEDEEQALAPCLEQATEALHSLVEQGVGAAMNRFNGVPPVSRPSEPESGG